jgi:hypothetical protein
VWDLANATVPFLSAVTHDHRDLYAGDQTTISHPGVFLMNASDRDFDVLDDDGVLRHESRDRAEFFRLERMEPQSPGTTFREIRGSRALLDAWARWTHSSVAARQRGLSPRRCDAL